MITLCPEPQAPRQARAFVRRRLVKLGFPKLVDDGALVAAELVTNAVTHAPYGPITLSLRPARGRPLIEVRDCSAVLPVLKPADYVAESGRGLHIVEALSLEYGWERTRSGKTVWAILA